MTVLETERLLLSRLSYDDCEFILELVKAGLQRCRALGVGAVAVLGHPEYYPRFGFRPSTQWSIKSEYDVPEDVFMMLELSVDYLQGYQGIIRYNAAFADL